MIVRAIDNDLDWVFGQGRQSYKSDLDAVKQIIWTHIYSWYRDCFFDRAFGIDWNNLIGYYDTKIQIQLAVRKQILIINEVTGVTDLSISLDENRKLSLSYSATTIYGDVSDAILVG